MSTSPAAISAESLQRATRFVSFSTLGVLRTTQGIAQAVLDDIDGADPELVTEETLSLVAVTTARAAEVGLQNQPNAAAAASNALVEVPYTYHEYLIGGAMVAREDSSLAEAGDGVYQRLERKLQFYTTHLPSDQFPGQHALTDKMALWMGRVSPPKLPESPQERLEKLNLVSNLLTHLKLVLAYGRQGSVA